MPIKPITTEYLALTSGFSHIDFENALNKSYPYLYVPRAEQGDGQFLIEAHLKLISVNNQIAYNKKYVDALDFEIKSILEEDKIDKSKIKRIETGLYKLIINMDSDEKYWLGHPDSLGRVVEFAQQQLFESATISLWSVLEKTLEMAARKLIVHESQPIKTRDVVELKNYLRDHSKLSKVNTLIDFISEKASSESLLQYNASEDLKYFNQCRNKSAHDTADLQFIISDYSENDLISFFNIIKNIFESLEDDNEIFKRFVSDPNVSILE